MPVFLGSKKNNFIPITFSPVGKLIHWQVFSGHGGDGMMATLDDLSSLLQP